MMAVVITSASVIRHWGISYDEELSTYRHKGKKLLQFGCPWVPPDLVVVLSPTTLSENPWAFSVTYARWKLGFNMSKMKHNISPMNFINDRVMGVNMVNFAQWLKAKMKQKKINQAELSRRSGLSSSQISKIVNMQSPPGKKALESIAVGLGVPLQEVLAEIGMIKIPDHTPTLNEVNEKVALLPEDQQQQVLDYVEYLLERKGGRDASSPAPPDSRKPLAPSRR
jgi:transcriptional regulator with XRE-family HTH domain